MSEEIKGVLLINLGTPDAPTRGAVYRYLKQFLLDRRVIDYPWLLRNILVRGLIAPFRSGSSAKLYQRLWTDQGSPLKIYGESLAMGVKEKLGPNYKVELAMRYQSPSIESAIRKLINAQVSSITVVPLFPQYASATTGSVLEEVMRILCREEVIPKLSLINSYCDDPRFVDLFVKKALGYDMQSYDHFIFSFHGIPERHLRRASREGYCLSSPDCCQHLRRVNQFCYAAQCHATAQGIAQELGLSKKQYTVSFQSRLGPEKWTSPYTNEVLVKQLENGKQSILVFSPAFVSDCLETTIEIGFEYKQEFLEAGGLKLDLVESLNDDPGWIELVAEMVRENNT